MLAGMANRLDALEAKVNQMIRVCTVSSVQDGAGTVRVKLPDLGNMVSEPLPVVVRKTQDDKDFWLPDVGEQVVCVFLPIGLEQGFVLGSFYQKVDKVPVSSRDKWHKRFKDGAVLEYDRASHILTATVPGEIDATAPLVKIVALTKVRMETPKLEVTGEIIDLCDDNTRTVSGMRQVHNAHVHAENDNGGPTDPSDQVM